MKNLIRNWLGIGGELERARIALAVAREIGENWKSMSETHEKQIRELMVENSILKDKNEQQQRIASITAKALSGLAPVVPTITKK